MKTAISLVALGLVSTVVDILGAAVMILRSDIQALQAQLGSRNPGVSKTISCADLAKVGLHVGARNIHCTTR